METVTALLSIEVLVDCPHCDYMIDLMKGLDTGGYEHNEEGGVVSQACPDGCWSEKHESFSVENVKCSACGCSFNVKELEW
jgi:hypothetical protein